jgi:hypothetical protein
MFFLWTGVMAGILLAYLVMRFANRSDLNQKGLRGSLQVLWASARWRFAAIVALLLFIPVPWEFIKTGFFGSFGPLEAFKTVLLPWLAGVGFGIWIYLTIASLQARQYLPGGLDADQGDAAAANRDRRPRALETRRELSFIPIAVAMLTVAFMITDQQYGWLARLQKFSFGGGGLEFAPRAARGPQEAVRGPGAEGGAVIGEDRVSALVDFTANLAAIITRDHGYLRELGNRTYNLQRDMEFAEQVVVPLGQHLDIFHDAHGYNNLGLLISRDFVDAIRSFVRYQHGVTPETQQLLADKVRGEIGALWRKICRREEDLPDMKVVDPKNTDKIRSCGQTAKAVDDWLSLQGRTAAFSYGLPYGTLLAAMLLNAADELDSAIKDIDEWVADSGVSDNDPAADPGKSWLVFRAVNQAMLLLLAGGPSSSNSYLALEHSRKLAKIGHGLLQSDAMPTSDSSTKLSWQAQSAKFDKAEPVDLLWELGVCPSGLTSSFKRAMLATLQASNNVAFILSENIEYANRQGLMPEMEQRANHLAKSVNTRCLAVETPEDATNRKIYSDLERLQAAFFDTAATVQLALVARGTQQQEKRRRLCDAHTYASRAITLQANTLGKEGSSFNAGLNRVAFLTKWTEHRQESTAYSRLAAYDRLLDEINSQLAQVGYSHADCS